MNSLLSSLLPGLAQAPDIHPIFVHFPIALWLTAAALVTLGAARSNLRVQDAGRICLWIGTAAALAAIATGYLAAGRMGHGAAGHELVHVHRNFMLASTGIAVLASLLAWRADPSTRIGSVGLAALLLVLATVSGLGADRGARLVFGYGMGVLEAPPETSGGHHDGGHDEGGHH